MTEVNKNNTLFSDSNLKTIEVQFNLERDTMSYDKDFDMVSLTGTYGVRCIFSEGKGMADTFVSISYRDMKIDYISGDIVTDIYVPYSMRYVSDRVFSSLEDSIKSVIASIKKGHKAIVYEFSYNFAKKVVNAMAGAPCAYLEGEYSREDEK